MARVPCLVRRATGDFFAQTTIAIATRLGFGVERALLLFLFGGSGCKLRSLALGNDFRLRGLRLYLHCLIRLRLRFVGT